MLVATDLLESKLRELPPGDERQAALLWASRVLDPGLRSTLSAVCSHDEMRQIGANWACRIDAVKAFLSDEVVLLTDDFRARLGAFDDDAFRIFNACNHWDEEFDLVDTREASDIVEGAPSTLLELWGKASQRIRASAAAAQLNSWVTENPVILEWFAAGTRVRDAKRLARIGDLRCLNQLRRSLAAGSFADTSESFSDAELWLLGWTVPEAVEHVQFRLARRHEAETEMRRSRNDYLCDGTD